MERLPIHRKTCDDCFEKAKYEKRLDTKRRPTNRVRTCLVCFEDAHFEYELPLNCGARNRFVGWKTMCKRCFDIWLRTGSHYESGEPVYIPSIGSFERPLMQDERDNLYARRRATLDNSTGLLTYNWRKP